MRSRIKRENSKLIILYEGQETLTVKTAAG